MNVTLTCQVTGGTGYSQATYLQIGKVGPGGSLSSLVELIPGAQQPVYTQDDFIRRADVSGNLNKGQGQVYLKVVIRQIEKSDEGSYRCSMTYLGNNNRIGHARTDMLLGFHVKDTRR